MSSAAKVGIFILIILAVLAFFILKIEDISIDRGGETKSVNAAFDSVAGLENKSAVRVAGVRKGKVVAVELGSDGRARVTLQIDADVVLHRGASASIANLGLLGEKYIELDPGDPSGPLLGDTAILPGTQPATIDEVTNQVSEIATDVKAITASLRNAVGTPTGQASLEEIVENVRAVTARVRMILEVNEGNLNATASNFRKITDDLRVEIPKIAASIERVASSFGGTVSENREDVRALVENLKGLSGDLRTTADNLNSITGQVKSGEGTVGKLIYSDEAHERLTGALKSVESGVNELKNTLGRAAKLELDLGIRSDYYAGLDESEFTGSSRSAVMLQLVPNPESSRFYNVELSDDPRGKKREKLTQTTTIDEAGNSTTKTVKEVRFDRDYVISAQAGWRRENLGFRVGLFDSMGGVAADYFHNERLSVTGEAFDFGQRRDPNPHLRLFSRYIIRKEKPSSPAIFISTGVDNPFNDTAFTFGGGIRWNDDDLKYLLGSVPIN